MELRKKENQLSPYTQTTLNTSCSSRRTELSSLLPQHICNNVSSSSSSLFHSFEESNNSNINNNYHADVLEMTIDRTSDLIATAGDIHSNHLYKTCLILSSNIESEEPDWNSEAVQELFQAIASMNQLEYISLNKFGMVCNSFPIHLITQVLSSHQLRSIHINCMSLLGTATEIQELAFSLEQQLQLETFMISYCGFSTAIEASCTLDLIVLSLSKLPNLRLLELWGYAEGKLGALQEHTLEQLLRSASLQSLHLEGFTLHYNHLKAIALSLQENRTLQKLDLHVLKQAPEGSVELVESLRHNDRLQYLEVFLSSNIQNDLFLTTMADMLKSNRSLKVFKVHTFRRVTPLEEETFADMLETNETLQVLDLAGYEGDQRPKIDYLLSWNRRGRQRPMLKPLKEHSTIRKKEPTRKSRNGKKKRSEVDILDNGEELLFGYKL